MRVAFLKSYIEYFNLTKVSDSKLKEYNLCLKSLPERYFDLNICQDESL